MKLSNYKELFKYAIYLTILLFFSSSLYAESVFLKDGSIVEGKIVKETDEKVEIKLSTGEMHEIFRYSILRTLYHKRYKDKKIIKRIDGSIVLGHIVDEDGENYVLRKDINSRDEIWLSKDRVDSIGRYKDEVKIKSEIKDNKTTEVKSGPSNLFIEFESGWNAYGGAIGSRLDYRISDDLSINTGVGLCPWMLRFSGALRYYIDYPYGLAFSLGLAYNTGFSNTSDDDSIVDQQGVETEGTVEYDYKPVTTINYSILYFIDIINGCKIYIECGYSQALQKTKYTYETENGYELAESEKDGMDIIAPGGIILSVGCSFPL